MADNFQLDEWRVREFEKNVYIKAQQGDSRLFGHAIQGTQAAKLKSYDVLGLTDVVERTNRYGDTPNIDVPHSRRSVLLKEYEWGKLIDDVDVLKIINDPTNPYVDIMGRAFARKKDHVFIAAALGPAREGEDGDTLVALPNRQKIASVKDGAHAPLNIEALKTAKYLLDTSEIDEDEERYMAISAWQLRALLGQTEITNIDYNNIKALVEGKVDTFMGFKFIRTELLVANTNLYNTTTGLYNAGGGSMTGESCVAWVKSGLRIVTGKNMSVQVTPRADKRNIPQIYGWMSIGGTRMEDVKVIEINCKNS